MSTYERAVILGAALLTVVFFVWYVWLNVASDGCESCGRKGQRLYKARVASDFTHQTHDQRQICYSCAHTYAVSGRLARIEPSYDRPPRRTRRRAQGDRASDRVIDKGTWP
jgi:hypothetical protein